MIDVASLDMSLDNEEDDDPILTHLRLLEYRYLRFVYNPLSDTFQSVSGWKDPLWKNTKLMRAGLDAEERDNRELVFGQNLIDVQQKSVSQLLVDEVSTMRYYKNRNPLTVSLGPSPFLYFPDRKPDLVVSGWVLLLRRVHFLYFIV